MIDLSSTLKQSIINLANKTNKSLKEIITELLFAQVTSDTSYDVKIEYCFFSGNTAYISIPLGGIKTIIMIKEEEIGRYRGA